MKSIAVIIVNYNTADLAISSVQSVLDRDVPGATIDVHIVDNASPDGDAQTLTQVAQQRGWGSRVHLYLEEINHGFGRGNNVVLHTLGKRAAPPDFVFFLNPDAALKNDVLPVLMGFMNSHPDAALLGTRSFNPGSADPVSAAFRFPNLAAAFSSAISFGPISRLFAKSDVALPGAIETQKVDWVSGAAVLARFDVLREVGFFDPEYFLYYEEVDLMRAVALAGWECWHVAEAEIIHIEGAATDVKSADTERPRRPAYWYHSWRYYIQKNHGRAYALTTGLAWLTGAALNHGLARLRGKQPKAPAHFFSDFWAMVMRPLLGLGARPY